MRIASLGALCYLLVADSASPSVLHICVTCVAMLGMNRDGAGVVMGIAEIGGIDSPAVSADGVTVGVPSASRLTGTVIPECRGLVASLQGSTLEFAGTPELAVGDLDFDTVLALHDQVRTVIGQDWVSELVIRPGVSSILADEIIALARESGRSVRINGPLDRLSLPTPSEHEEAGPEGADGPGGWMLRPRRLSPWQRIAKRTLDIVAALALLICLSPILLAIGLIVRLSSPGPMLYAWHVLGKDGRPFTGYKFRTMVKDADKLKAQLMARNEMVGPVFKIKHDPRITPIGRWLRKYSLDELPQLWSVLIGNMSLVGPRPPSRAEYRRFQLWQMRKLSVTPGVTCLWQVRGRNEISDFADWARLDLEYIDHRSLGLDIRILLETAWIVVRGTGR